MNINREVLRSILSTGKSYNKKNFMILKGIRAMKVI